MVIAAVLVYKFLPSDRDSIEVTGEGDEVEPDAAEFDPLPSPATEIPPIPTDGCGGDGNPSPTAPIGW